MIGLFLRHSPIDNTFAEPCQGGKPLLLMCHCRTIYTIHIDHAKGLAIGNGARGAARTLPPRTGTGPAGRLGRTAHGRGCIKQPQTHRACGEACFKGL